MNKNTFIKIKDKYYTEDQVKTYYLLTLVPAILLIFLGLILLLVSKVALVGIAIGVLCLVKARSYKAAVHGERFPDPNIPVDSPVASDGTVYSSTPSNVRSENHKIAGVQYYVNDSFALLSENYMFNLSKSELIDEYDGSDQNRFYEYEYYTHDVQLLPDPDNQYDPNAIKVLAGGLQIGHIKKGSTGRIKNLLNSGTIKNYELELAGGKYKQVVYDYENDCYSIERGESPYFATLTIYMCAEE